MFYSQGESICVICGEVIHTAHELLDFQNNETSHRSCFFKLIIDELIAQNKKLRARLETFEPGSNQGVVVNGECRP